MMDNSKILKKVIADYEKENKEFNKVKFDDIQILEVLFRCMNEVKKLPVMQSSSQLKEKYTPEFQEFLKDHCKEVKRSSLWLYKGNEWDIDYLYRKYNKKIKPTL